jgi:hypothetical protein
MPAASRPIAARRELLVLGGDSLTGLERFELTRDRRRVLSRPLPGVHVVPHSEADDREAGRQVEGDRQGEIQAGDGEIDSEPEEQRRVEQAAQRPCGPEPPTSASS